MHGIIFVELQKFVTKQAGADAWRKALSAANLSNRVYLAV